ncbi:MAG: hypothetical protein WC238_01585 [Parcubacteria group bacterium]|jgi:amidophosphoribosyltransferase
MLGIGGIACVVNLQNAAKHVSKLLQRLRHRGADVINIASVGKNEDPEKKPEDPEYIGYYEEKTPCEGTDFEGFPFEEGGQLLGPMAIGFCFDVEKRISAIKDRRQMHIIESAHFGLMVIAFSGKTELSSSGKINNLSKECCTLSSDNGFDTLVRMLIGSKKERLIDALLDVLPRFTAAYTLAIMTKDELFAARGPHGVFPLFLGRIGKGLVVTSEDVALKQNPQAELIEEIGPGEIVSLKRDSPDYQIHHFAKSEEMLCAVECIHMSSPITTHRGIHIEDFRQALGREFAREHRERLLKAGKNIVPMMRSGKDQGSGVSDESGIPYTEYIKLDKNRPRTRNRPLTKISYEKALERSYQKTILREDKIKSKSIIVVESIMITSMNMRIINERLHKAGASRRTTCITAPMVTNVCPSGMEHSTTDMLIAYGRTLDEIRILIGTDDLLFLSLAGLKKVLSETFHTNFCTGCFGGDYPK